MTIALLLLLWLVIIIIFNYIDWAVTHDGGKPDYGKYFVMRGAAAILHGVLLLIVNEDAYTNYGSLSAWQLLILWLPYLGFQVCSFWILYELIRNKWTGRDWLYYDSEEKDSGFVDRFFAWAGPTYHGLAKIISLIICLLCIFLIWTRH